MPSTNVMHEVGETSQGFRHFILTKPTPVSPTWTESHQCPVSTCKKMCLRPSDLRSHFTLKHPSHHSKFPSLVTGGKYLCSCGARFSRKRTFELHSKEHKVRKRKGVNKNAIDFIVWCSSPTWNYGKKLTFVTWEKISKYSRTALLKARSTHYVIIKSLLFLCWTVPFDCVTVQLFKQACSCFIFVYYKVGWTNSCMLTPVELSAEVEEYDMYCVLNCTGFFFPIQVTWSGTISFDERSSCFCCGLDGDNETFKEGWTTGSIGRSSDTIWVHNTPSSLA